MDSVACEEDTFVLGEVRSDTLSDLIGSPPAAVLIVDLVRSHDLLGGLENHVWCDLGAVVLVDVSL